MTSLSSLSQISVGGRVLKNRVVVTSHTYGLLDGTKAGVEAMCAYVEERLAGGVAALVLGETSIDGGGVGWGAASSGDNLIDFYQAISSIAAREGAVVIEQLYSPGGQVWHEEQHLALAPSSVPHSRSYVVPETLSAEDIRFRIAAFVRAASSVAAGGLNGVEIKADQGKLVHQFLAPRFNRRTDEWGGAEVGARARFLLEILREIRRSHPELILGVRLPLVLDESELQLGDLALTDLIKIAQLIDSEHLVDYVSVTAETNSTARGYWIGHPDTQADLSAYRSAAHLVRDALSVPLLYAGGVLTLDRADEIIRGGSADMIAMTRASIADPDLLRKHKEGRSSEIRPCIACNDGCVGNTWFGRPIRCSVNPHAGREALVRRIALTLAPRPSTRAVAIIGAGPAGLQCALTLAEHGVKSDLFEKSDRIGGQLILAQEIVGNERISEYINWMQAVLEKSSLVSIHFDTEVSPETLEAANYQEIVIATGSRPAMPEQFRYLPMCITDVELLTKPRSWEGSRVIVVDSERTRDALGVADWLATNGAEVEVVTPFDVEGLGLNPAVLVPRLFALRRWDIPVSRWSEVVRVDGRTVDIFDQISGGVTQRLDVDALVFVCNGIPARVSEQWRTRLAGNAKMEGKLEDATRSGHDMAMEVLDVRKRTV